MSDPSNLRVEGQDGAGNLRGVLPAGTSLRGYELKSILGQGAFGITYRARDLNLDREVAIKEYLPTSLALREGRTTVMPRSPDHAEQFAWGRERFLEEARTLARLDRTPAIVRVHDFLEDNGTAYMVMALIEGETLAKRLSRETRLTAEAVERILFPLLDGLEEVHGIGFLHRDIKPANIMIDRAGRPTLIDFGASRAAMAERTSTMTAIFTPGYAAAEQFTSANLGPWTDIYGLAATMYHAVTGTISPSAIDRILKDDMVPLAERHPPPDGFAPELLAGIDAGMAIRAEARPQTLAQWRHVLRSGEAPVPAMEMTQIARRPSRRRTGLALRGPALWSAAAAAVLLVAGAGWLAYRANAPTTVDTAALTLSTEQLEQALAERRRADALAAEKRRLEAEARQRADTEAESKRQAEAELQRAREARQQAEQELAELKARIAASARDDQAAQHDQQATAEQREREAEAQRQAEAQAATLRAAEEEARQKAEADAEAKRLADAALADAEAARQKAEQEAEAKVAAEKQAMQQASEDSQRKAAEAERQKAEAEAKTRADAEAAEKALKLEMPDRQRLQAALTALGFDTRGADGLLGPRSREMIANWQKARSLAPTGFVDAAQRQQLLKEAEPALAKLDEKQKAEEEAKARSAAPAAPSAAAPTMAGAATRFDGSYSGQMTYSGSVKGSLQIVRGAGTFVISAPGCDPLQFPVSVSGDGALAAKTYINCAFGAASTGSNLRPGDYDIDGRIQDDVFALNFRSSANTFTMRLRLDRAPGGTPPAATPPVAAVATAFDGSYSGIMYGGSVALSLQVSRGTGTFGLDAPACVPVRIPVSVTSEGLVTGKTYINCAFGASVTGANLRPGDFEIDGRFQGDELPLNFRNSTNTFRVVVRRDRAPSGVARHDGTYRGDSTVSGYSNSGGRLFAELVVRNGSGSGTLTSPGCRASPVTVTITAAGEISGQSDLACVLGGSGYITGLLAIAGRSDGKALRLDFRSERGGGSFSMVLRPGEGVAPPPPSPFDGSYVGGASIAPGAAGLRGPAVTRLQLEQGRGVLTLQAPGCETSNFAVAISATGAITGQGRLVCTFSSGGNTPLTSGDFAIDGAVDGTQLALTFRSSRLNFYATMRREGSSPSPR